MLISIAYKYMGTFKNYHFGSQYQFITILGCHVQRVPVLTIYGKEMCLPKIHKQLSVLGIRGLEVLTLDNSGYP